MPAIRAAAKKKDSKPKPATRSRARVEDTEESTSSIVRSAKHRNGEDTLAAQARNLGNGAVLITSQLSELVPVAQYANVTLGPNQLAWVLDADMSVLTDVDWDDDSPLSDEQQAVFDRVMGALKATSRLLEIHLSDDRESVERSVRQHNEREASEAAEKKPRRSRR